MHIVPSLLVRVCGCAYDKCMFWPVSGEACLDASDALAWVHTDGLVPSPAHCHGSVSRWCVNNLWQAGYACPAGSNSSQAVSCSAGRFSVAGAPACTNCRCVCLCMYVCVCLCVWVCMYVCGCVGAAVCGWVCVCMYVCGCVGVYVCVFVCVCLWVWVFVCVCARSLHDKPQILTARD